MQIVLNHVTRMRRSRICVAGIECGSLTHMRPTTSKEELLTRELLRAEGGPFGPGALVDLGEVVPEGSPPEVEDRRFVTGHARHVEDLSDQKYLTLLASVADDSVKGAFGADLREIRPRKFAIPKGHGQRSLAVIPVEAAELQIAWGNLYVSLRDGDVDAKLRVTDVRFYEPDHKTIKVDLMQDVSRRMAGGVEAYAMLGLARAMRDQDGGDVHWLQCNGICLADRAVSDVP